MPLAQSGGSNVGTSQIIDNEIMNADVNTNAGIEKSKLAGFPLNKTTLLKPLFPIGSGVLTGKGFNDATKLYVGLVKIAEDIIVNKLSFIVNTVTTPGTVDISLYSEDGQTKMFTVTSGTISEGGITTLDLSAVSIPAGNYYLAINTNGSAYMNMYFWEYSTAAGLNSYGGLVGAIAGKNDYGGLITITSGVTPDTINPTAITFEPNATLCVRLDN